MLPGHGGKDPLGVHAPAATPVLGQRWHIWDERLQLCLKAKLRLGVTRLVQHFGMMAATANQRRSSRS